MNVSVFVFMYCETRLAESLMYYYATIAVLIFTTIHERSMEAYVSFVDVGERHNIDSYKWSTFSQHFSIPLCVVVSVLDMNRPPRLLH